MYLNAAAASTVGVDGPTLIGAFVALFVALVGSSALGTVFSGWFSRRRERHTERRGDARRALAALRRAQLLVNELSDRPLLVEADDLRRLAARGADLEVAVALAGKSELNTAVRAYRDGATLFVVGDIGVTALAQRALFERVVDLLSVHSK